MSNFIRLPNGDRVLVGGTDKQKEIEADKSKAAPILREMKKFEEKRAREAAGDAAPTASLEPDDETPVKTNIS